MSKELVTSLEEIAELLLEVRHATKLPDEAFMRIARAEFRVHALLGAAFRGAYDPIPVVAAPKPPPKQSWFRQALDVLRTCLPC